MKKCLCLNNFCSFFANSIKTAEVSSILKIGFKWSNLLDNLTGFLNLCILNSIFTIYYSAKELLGGANKHNFIFENNSQCSIKLGLEKHAKGLF